MKNRIAIVGTKSTAYIKILLGIWNNSDCACLFDYNIPTSTLCSMIEEASIVKCYIENGLHSDFARWCNVEVEYYIPEPASIQIVPRQLIDNFNSSYSKNEAAVVYSSGTTGKSKGIILSYYGINTNADYICQLYPPNETHTLLIARNLFHSSTLVCDLLVALKKHWNIILTDRVSPKDILTTISKYRITIMCVNPSILRLYNRYLSSKRMTVPSIKRIFSSGDSFDVKTYLQTSKNFPNAEIYNCYGLSECGPRVTCISNPPTHNGFLSVGKKLGSTEIKILGNNGEVMPPYEIGTIFVKSPCLFLNYINDSSNQTRSPCNWFDTKDLGFIDDNNNLYIAARKDDLIIIDAHKIYPQTIEEIIRSYPGILDCFVSSISFHNKKELVCLYETETSITESCLIEHCKNFLIGYEIPHLLFNTKILRNSNGKIDRQGNSRLILNILTRGQNYE